MYSKAELKQLKIDFWEGFGSYCRFKKVFRHREGKFILYDTKIRGVEMKFEATREGVSVILELTGDHEQRAGRFAQFWIHEAILQGKFPDPLTWIPSHQRESGELVGRIFLHKPGLDIHRRERWVAIYEFMAENMRRMEDAFVEVREFLE